MTPEQIHNLRIALGLSQSEMASRLGLDGDHARNTIDKFENGIKAPSGPVRKLLEIMNKDIGHD